MTVTADQSAPVSNARLIAELQAVTLGIHLVGLDRLPEVMRGGQTTPAGYGAEGGMNHDPLRASPDNGGER